MELSKRKKNTAFTLKAHSQNSGVTGKGDEEFKCGVWQAVQPWNPKPVLWRSRPGYSQLQHWPYV